MIDIISADTGLDLGLYDTQTKKAENLLSVQLGGLEYLPLFGIDLAFFLTEAAQFQNESFKAYLIEVLANNGINVASVLELVENLSTNYTINLTPAETSTGFVAR
jgi:hypothetical protein